MPDLAAALREVRAEGVVATLGRHPVFRFRVVTPAHTFESVVKDVGQGRLVELTARDSFDDRLAKFLLDQVDGLELPTPRARTVRVAPAKFPRPWTFDTIVVAPPVVAKRFEHESAVLQKVTYWVVPAFSGEFADRADGAAFWFQVRREDGWHSPVVRWDRVRKIRPKWKD